MKEEERQRYLIGYIDQSLSSAEMSEVERWLEEDPGLKEEIMELQFIQQDMRQIGRNEFVNKVANWEADYKKPRRQVGYGRYLSIAASLLVIVAATIIILRPADTASLYEDYYSTYDDLISTRGAGETTRLSEGMAAYNDANYTEAADQLSQYVVSHDEPLAWLYLGISHLEMEEYDQALLAFGAASSETITAQQAAWYTGLTYLKSGDKASAISTFEQVAANPGHYKQKEASEILDALD